MVPLHDRQPDPHHRAAAAALRALAPSVQLVDGYPEAVAAELAQVGAVRRASRHRLVRSVDRARRDADLPALVLGIPYAESRFDTRAVSRSCAGGMWQLLPETAVSLGLEVAGCTLIDRDLPWTPAPNASVSRFSPYRGRVCGIQSCDVDQRLEPQAATRAAMRYLRRVWRAPDVAAHPQRAPLTVLSYNTGEARARWWLQEHADPMQALARCSRTASCSAPREHARYVPRVVAGAALVLCNAPPRAEPRVHREMCAVLADAGLAPAAPPASVVEPDRSTLQEQLQAAGLSAPLELSMREQDGVRWVELQADSRLVAALYDPRTERTARELWQELSEPADRPAARRIAEALVKARAQDLASCAQPEAIQLQLEVRFRLEEVQARAIGPRTSQACVEQVISGIAPQPALSGAIIALRVELPGRRVATSRSVPATG